ncbi:hypothetical protein SBA2_220007 [Acidobacteriia bacterium SbA2]|nr:hypothetical protein SBA2_220007 [Acidobacteriia bacterium SbA2]
MSGLLNMNVGPSQAKDKATPQGRGLWSFHSSCQTSIKNPLPLGGEGGPRRRFHQPSRAG